MSDQAGAPEFPARGRFVPDQDDAVDAAEPILPEPVRLRVINLTASAIGGLPTSEVPIPLRRVAKFAPNRRARLGGSVLAAYLSTDALFRQRIAKLAAEAAGELGAAVAAGAVPATADPVDIAALAYLARPAGWRELIEEASEAVALDTNLAEIGAAVYVQEQRADRAEHERALARVEVEKLRAEVNRLREEVTALRDESRTLAGSLRETKSREKRANDLLATERGRIARMTSDHEAEVRRLRAKLAEAESAAGSSRQSAKGARAVNEARLWLLLETVTQAASGLRRELALDPATILPADLVAETDAEQAGGGRSPQHKRSLDADDPARLDQLLALPKAHLIVDGYNVTKTGFPEIALEQQRARLVSGMAGIAAQTGAEVTVVFDGAERMVGLPHPPRGVRVLFSRKGVTADELIRSLVRGEPPGRPVIVISSDREVADGVRRHGAYPLSAATLIRRLARA